MADVERVRKLLEDMTLGLVDDEAKVKFETVRGIGASFTFRVTCGPNDLGKLVGKQGRTARAMRVVLAGVARKAGIVAQLDLVNTAPPMTEVWAFVSRDRDGNENIVGSLAGPMGVQPFLTGNRQVFGLFLELVREMRAQLPPDSPQTLHLLHFTNREELDW